MTNTQSNTQSANSSLKRIQIQAWISTILSALLFFYWINQNTLNSVLKDYYTHKYHLLHFMPYTTFTALYLIGSVILYIPAGFLLDRYSTKKIILTVLIFMIIGASGLLRTHTALIACGFMLLIGLSGAFALLSMMRMVSNWFSPKDSGFPMALCVTIGMLGGTYASSFGTWLRVHYSPHAVQFQNVILGIVIFILILLFAKDGAKVEKPKTTTSHVSFAKTFLQILKNTQNWKAGLYISLLNLPIMILAFSIGPDYLMAKFGSEGKNAAATCMSMLLIGTMIGGPLLGRLSDALKNRKSLMIIFGSLSLLCLLPFVLSIQINTFELILLFLVMGLVTSAQSLGYPVIAENNSPHLIATAMSLASILIMGGGAIAQIFYGYLYFKFGYINAFWMLPVCMFIAIFLAMRLKSSSHT